MDQIVDVRFVSLEKRFRLLTAIVLIQAICIVFLYNICKHDSRLISEENNQIQTFDKIRANSIELVSSLGRTSLQPTCITLSSPLSSTTTELSAYNLAFRGNQSTVADDCIFSPSLFYMCDRPNGPSIRMSISDNSSEVALFGDKNGGRIYIDNNIGRPSVRLHDSLGNIRAVLGCNQRLDDKGTAINYTESTITLCDPKGNIFFQVPK